MAVDSPGKPWRPAAERSILVTRAGEALSWKQTAGEVRAFSGELPDSRYIVNLCQGRHGFMVVLLAAALAERTILLPSERAAGALRKLVVDFPGLCAVVDSPGSAELAANAGIPITEFAVRASLAGSLSAEDWQCIGDARLVQFTSGSTGRPEANYKTFGYLREGARGNAAAMLDGLDATPVIVATVPPYHMYGLETSIALPLFSDSRVYEGRPFYPRDIAGALESLPAPRLLVSTPAHLRVLAESEVSLPPVARIFSATAPLPADLARGLEEMTGGEVREIYGTTEAGIIGWRRTAAETAFRLVAGMSLEAGTHGAVLSAPHISPAIVLSDSLEVAGDGRFRIAGRSNDIVNIAGKRMSLSGMNAILAEVDGVCDGAFIAPPDDAEGPVKRMTAFVVAPSRDEAQIRSALKRELDAAFLPRRIHFVDALPRNEAGKLPLEGFRKFARERLLAEFRAEKAVDLPVDERFFAGHFPGAPIVPGAVLLDEAWRLLVEGFCGLAAEFEITNAKFPASAGPGEPCRFRATASRGRRIRVEAVQAGRTVLQAVFAVAESADDG